MVVAPADEQLQAIERWFMARGTPHLMEGYSASSDVLTRMIPTLTAVAVLEVLGALDADFTWWQNTLAGLVGLLSLVGLWAGVNALLSRPALSRPAASGQRRSSRSWWRRPSSRT